jgi:hypothetical protein
MSVGAIVACIALLGGVLFAGAADAKKKKKKAKPAACAVTAQATGGSIPDRPPGTSFFGFLNVPIAVNNAACASSTVTNVDLTYQTTGATAIAAGDLFFRLQAPDGRTYAINGNGFSGQNIGPVTFTQRTRIQTCVGAAAPPPPPCTDPDQALNPPYQGTARDEDLANYYGAPVNGTWTLTAYDAFNGDTSILNLARVAITGTPGTVKVKKKKKKKKK